jgi:hypothetical protein
MTVNARRWRWWILGAAVTAVSVVIWLVWRAPGEAPAPRERQYRSDLACLLTDDKGVTGSQAAPVWAGLRDASEAILVRSQSLAVTGEQSQANAMSFLASLVQRQCGLVIAVGSAPVAAVLSGSQRFTGPTYAVVANAAVASPILTVVGGDPVRVRADVKALVEKTFASSG